MRRGWIDRCIKSLQASTVQTTAIIIDNGSTDGTREHIPVHYPNAIWLPQEKNLGFGQGNNVGIRYALSHGADYILLLNQDASISTDAIERMLEATDDESLLSPLHLNGDGTHLDKMFLHHTIRQGSDAMTEDLLLRRHLEKRYETGEVCAACWFMPVSLVKKVGGFNPLFFQYSEDNNYYQRTLYHHVKTYVVPEARMYHDRNQHGDILVFKKNQTYREMLLIISDINKGSAEILTALVKLLIRCYSHDLRQKMYKPGAFISSLWKIISNHTSIRQSRKAEKEEKMNWI